LAGIATRPFASTVCLYSPVNILSLACLRSSRANAAFCGRVAGKVASHDSWFTTDGPEAGTIVV
jgi:hypothetical protein